jgi:hypothetical protein
MANETLVFLICLRGAVCGVWAGGSPDVATYASFDPSGEFVHSVEEAQQTTVSVCIRLPNVELRVTDLTVKLGNPIVECPGVVATKSLHGAASRLWQRPVRSCPGPATRVRFAA